MEYMLTFHILNVYVDKTQPCQFKFTFKKYLKNIPYVITTQLYLKGLHCTELILFTVVFEIDQSKIIVIYKNIYMKNNYICVLKSYNYFDFRMPVQSDND